jgi:hypothetical protein
MLDLNANTLTHAQKEQIREFCRKHNLRISWMTDDACAIQYLSDHYVMIKKVRKKFNANDGFQYLVREAKLGDTLKRIRKELE